MFWGDRCGTVLDPDGYAWMVGTHKAEPTAKEMKKGMEKMVKHQPTEAAAALRTLHSKSTGCAVVPSSSRKLLSPTPTSR